MKRMLHRLLSAALALLMTATFVLPGFAAGDESAAADPTGIAIALPPNLTVGVDQTVDLYLAVEPFTALPEQFI